MMSEEFKVGDHVVYQPHGIGTIVGSEKKGSEGERIDCFAVAFPSGMRAFIPVEAAKKTLRHLSSKKQAETDLQVLRNGGVERDQRFHRERLEERTRILRSGSRDEITTLLRRLYAAKAPVSEGDGVAIRALEDLVLAEISLVLGIPRSNLENEMRDRYPVFANKKR